MALAAVLFFSQLRNNYSAAVTFITLYALSAFGLLGVQSTELLLPRLVDTLLGAGIAFVTVMGCWPDWQYRHLPRLLQNSLQANRDYLAIQLQKETSADAELNYRIIRRRAHLADIALAQSWQSMLAEPRNKQRFLHLCAALTQRSHTLIAYISTLGAHRQQLADHFRPEQHELARQIMQTLNAASQAMAGDTTSTVSLIPLDEENPKLSGERSEREWLIQQELLLLAEQANDLLRLSWLIEPLKLSVRD